MKNVVYALCVLGVAGPAVARGERLTLTEAVERAVKENREIGATREGIAAAEARVSGASAQRFPRLRADANVFLWNEAIEVSLAPPGTPNPPTITVRDQITGSVTLTLAQPISGLVVLGTLIGVEQAGVSVARADLDRARLDVGYRAAESYLRILQAQAGRDIAQKSLEQITAQLERAKVLEGSGVLGRVDILRIEAARDSARTAVLRAEAAVATAGHALVLSIGLRDGTEVTVVDDLAEPAPPIPWTEEKAIETARLNRPELRGAERRIEQARGAKQIAKSGYLPNINGVATYQHNEGNGEFSTKDSAFVGVTLQWDLWDWGKTRASVSEAAARERQARIGLDAAADGIVFDVRRRYLEARTAHETLAVAKSALTASEEAYRITSVRFKEGAATTTDVLDAETDVARARTGYTVARYDYFIARAGLARAIGELPAR
jgi:outer membrane protein